MDTLGQANNLYDLPKFCGILLILVEFASIAIGCYIGYTTYKSIFARPEQSDNEHLLNDPSSNLDDDDVIKQNLEAEPSSKVCIFYKLVLCLITICGILFSDVVLLGTRFSGSEYQIYNNYIINNSSLDYSMFNGTEPINKLFLYRNIAKFNVILKSDVNISKCSPYEIQEIKMVNTYYGQRITFFIYTLLLQFSILVYTFSFNTMEIMGVSAKGRYINLLMFVFSASIAAGKMPLTIFEFTDECLVPINFVQLAIILCFSYMFLYMVGVYAMFNFVGTFLEGKNILSDSGLGRKLSIFLLIVVFIWMLLGFAMTAFQSIILLWNGKEGIIMFSISAFETVLELIGIIFF